MKAASLLKFGGELLEQPERLAALASMLAIVAGRTRLVVVHGGGRDGTLFNVNADTLAGHLAGRLQVRRLVIAGATPGVLDGRGHPVARLDRAGAEAMVQSGVASAGMIAKLRASMAALAAGVEEVLLVDGREAQTLATVLEAPSGDTSSLPGTRMVA